MPENVTFAALLKGWDKQKLAVHQWIAATGWETLVQGSFCLKVKTISIRYKMTHQGSDHWIN